MGFITPNAGGADLFIHRSCVLDGTTLIKGSQVTFEASFDEVKQKPIAIKCAGGLDPAAQAGGWGVPVAPPQATGYGGKGYGAVHAAYPPARSSPYGVPGPQYATGTVQAWKEEKGMGFIRPSDGSPDVFVHRSVLQDGLQSLQGIPSVSYEPGWDEKKGKPIAAKVWADGPQAWAPPPAIAWTPPAAPAGKGYSSVPPPGGLNQGPVVVAPPPHMAAQQAPGGLQSGVVKEWKNDRGMGFIAPDSGGPDLFAHRSQITDGEALVKGSQVNFEASFDARKGKPIAINITGGVAAGADPMQLG